MALPACYGQLYEASLSVCQACLVRDNCREAMGKDQAAPTPSVRAAEFPKSKKLLILMVCKKFGIDPTYKARRGECKGIEYTVTEESMGEYHNLDFLLTHRDALVKLLEA